MKITRAITAGIQVWGLGVSVFSLSYFMPLLENLDLQANIALSISIIPLAWIGAYLYYRKGSRSHGIKVAAVMVLTAITLDALITVPFIIIPSGGNYYSFFMAPSFWTIALEYFGVVIIYWHLKVKELNIKVNN